MQALQIELYFMLEIISNRVWFNYQLFGLFNICHSSEYVPTNVIAYDNLDSVCQPVEQFCVNSKSHGLNLVLFCH